MPKFREPVLLFVSHNQHKVDEMQRLFPFHIKLLGLSDIGWSMDIAEPYDTFEKNAAVKASTVYAKTGYACFADDSGLEVEALDGRPGVYSARYAGEHRSSADNVRKVLSELDGRRNRRARFVDVIAFANSTGNISTFTGVVSGTIALQPLGHGGFGYDPIFIPDGFDQTFGQLPSTLKDKVSHRAKAIAQFLAFLA